MALSLAAFFHTGWTDVAMWGVLVVAVVSTILLTRLFLAVLPFPTLVLPFLIVTWVLIAVAPELGVLNPIVFTTTAAPSIHPFTAVLHSLGQTMFSPNLWTGVFFIVGVFLSNWRHGLLALLGAVIGTTVSYYNRDVVDPSGLSMGLYGFNGVLAAVSVFVFCGGKLRLAILGAFMATILVPVVPVFGVQALSAPFVLTTWFMLALGWIEFNWFDVKPASASSTVPAPKPDATAQLAPSHPGE